MPIAIIVVIRENFVVKNFHLAQNDENFCMKIFTSNTIYSEYMARV